MPLLNEQPNSKSHPCAMCGRPTDLRGHVFSHILRKKGEKFVRAPSKKEYRWWCKEHYLQFMFNLYPFQCTKECEKKLSKLQGVMFLTRRNIVWLDLFAAMTADHKAKAIHFGDIVSRGMKAAKPKCPHCGKIMRMVKGDEIFTSRLLGS